MQLREIHFFIDRNDLTIHKKKWLSLDKLLDNLFDSCLKGVVWV